MQMSSVETNKEIAEHIFNYFKYDNNISYILPTQYLLCKYNGFIFAFDENDMPEFERMQWRQCVKLLIIVRRYES